ncbi:MULTISPECIES: hypothetical protein [unclassified Methylobacterium]|uniref:hypothetical protein n=1 Tax=unclassified Methylobacterium TaxID=2615210 RepID=UPI0011C1EA10|nr:MULTISPECIES: hypothetical protein [unclassified Methylobacterium]QEE39818.1 hypothetical protein FVA80_13515 [Methylobacterium sp. WL1]TXN57338.1 hypothetical protein FV241_11795 [Methylobacterium sp. WL2]
MPQPVDGGIAVGTIDGRPLTYYARIPTADGIEMTHAQIADALKEAIDEACEALWGSEWSGPLSVATGLNRRSCSKDRVWKFGLPAWALKFMAEASSQPYPRAIGDFLCGIARVHDDDALKTGTVRPRSNPSRELLMDQVQGRLIQAVDLLYTMRKARVQAQSRGGDLETNS